MRGILRSGLRFAVVAAFLALAAGCSVWVMGVVQSFGSQNGPKISTVVGNGTGGYTGDGGPATAAEIHQPYHVAMNSAGILYVSDTDNQVIRKVDTSGTASTFVPLSAGLNSPVGVAVDPSSTNIYVSDSGNYVIRQVTSGGVVTTVAGTGTSGHSGDGGIATSAQLGYPYGVAVDSAGNVYVADMYNSAIRMLSGGNLSTVAGTLDSAGYSGDGFPATSARLNYPMDVAVDTSIPPNIYIADSSNYVVRKVSQSGTITTVAGTGVNGYSGDGGPATSAQIGQPYGVTVDSAGNLYISDSNNVVRKVDTSGKISTVAGNYHLAPGYAGDGNVATAATLYAPWGLTFDLRGNLLIADRLNNRIRKVGFGQ